MNSNVLALGYKDEHEHIVVTDVLCCNFPAMTRQQKGDLSRELTEWADTIRRSETVDARARLKRCFQCQTLLPEGVSECPRCSTLKEAVLTFGK